MSLAHSRAELVGPAQDRRRDAHRRHHPPRVVPDAGRHTPHGLVGLAVVPGDAVLADLGQLGAQPGRRGDAARRHAGQGGPARKPGVQGIRRQSGEQHLAHRGEVGGQPPTDRGDHPHRVGTVHLGHIDHVGAVEHGDVHGLVAGGRDVAGRVLRLADQVEPVGELAAQLEQPHAEPEPGRRAGHRLEVAAVDQGGHQFVHGRAGQAEPFGDLRCGQVGPVQEQLEDVQCPAHRRNGTTHAFLQR